MKKLNKKYIVPLVILVAALLVFLAISLTGDGYGTGDFNDEDQIVFCEPEDREAEVCTMEYAPVCGYDAEENELGTFGNSCVACMDIEVEYYIQGEC